MKAKIIYLIFRGPDDVAVILCCCSVVFIKLILKTYTNHKQMAQVYKMLISKISRSRVTQIALLEDQRCWCLQSTVYAKGYCYVGVYIGVHILLPEFLRKFIHHVCNDCVTRKLRNE